MGLFEKLLAASRESNVRRSDYYDEASGWDVSGLISDLQLCGGVSIDAMAEGIARVVASE